MQTRLTLSLFTLGLVMSACAVSPLQSGALPLPPVPIVQSHYSFSPPAQPGWVLINRNAYQVQLARRVDDFGGTAAIQATLANLAYDGTPQGLLDHIMSRTVASTDPKRFDVQHRDHRIAFHDGQTCVRTEDLILDKQARQPDGGTTPMLLNRIQLTCPLPDKPVVAMSLTYSVRYRALKPQTGVRAEVEQLLQTLKFSGHSAPRLQT